MRPWTAPTGARAPAAQRSFNGATALRPWTETRRAYGGLPSTGLQWGHGLAAVDGHGSPSLFLRAKYASMGPRPCGRGRGCGACRRKGATSASMGPRPCGRGRFSPLPPHSSSVGASMGPRPCGRGRLASRLPRGGGQIASMGPRPCGRGRTVSALSRNLIHPGFNGATALRTWTVGN